MQAQPGTKRRRAGASAGAKAPTGEIGSRQRLIDSATACILDQGFYRASSNAIAERAGVSWGVIQYHFGSREALMLAVLGEGTRRLNETLATAEITGGTVTERVAQYADILARYYGTPEYLAYTQVLINLAHDPRTSEQTRATMAGLVESAGAELDRLLRKVLAGTGIRRPAVRSTLLHALRGLALSHVIPGTRPDRPDGTRQFAEERGVLAEALGMFIEANAKQKA